MPTFQVSREIPGWWVETWTVEAKSESSAIRKLRDCKDLSKLPKGAAYHGGEFAEDPRLGSDYWEAGEHSATLATGDKR